MRWLSVVFVVYLLGQAFWTSMQRYFLWGEVLVALCIPLCLKRLSTETNAQKLIIYMVYVWVFAILLFGIFVTSAFWSSEFQLIYFFRHLPIFYYAAFFFAAYYLADRIIPLLRYSVLPIILAGFLRLLTPFFSFFGGVLSTSMIGLQFFGVLQCRYSPALTVALYAILAVLLICEGTLTPKIAGLLVIVFPVSSWLLHRIIPKLRETVVGLAFGILIICCVLWGISALPVVTKFYNAGFALNEDIAYRALNLEAGVELENSAWWRVVFWYYLARRFISAPYGIGLGTPLYEKLYENVLNMPARADEAFLVGAHNSFLTLVVRFGVPALVWVSIILGLIFIKSHSIFSEFKLSNLRNKPYSLALAATVNMLIVTCHCMFNVGIESPIHAAFFWTALGLFTKYSCADWRRRLVAGT